MHTTVIPDDNGDNWVFSYNSDYSGDIFIGRAAVCAVPTSVLLKFVGEMLRTLAIKHLQTQPIEEVFPLILKVGNSSK